MPRKRGNGRRNRPATHSNPSSTTKGSRVAGSTRLGKAQPLRRGDPSVSPGLEPKILLGLLDQHQGPISEVALARELGILRGRQRKQLADTLRQLERQGTILRTRVGEFARVDRTDLLAGVVLANAEGYGFFRPDSGTEDIYLSPAEMRKVLHGDRILASIIGLDHRGRKRGAIVEILARRPPRLVGKVVEDGGITVVVPDDPRLHQDVLIPDSALGKAHAGQIVVAEITEPPSINRGPVGRVVSILGDHLQPSLAVEMAIAGHNLPCTWPAKVLHEAAAIPDEVDVLAESERQDLRDLPLVTIDGEDARDFDDAVYAKPSRNGGYRLLVAIADVAHYLPVDSALDQQARQRATSVYFPGFVVPMLPETLSNGICSLKPETPRLAMVCDMHVDAAGVVQRSRFYPALIRSHARLTYQRVWAALGQGDVAERQRLGALLPVLENLQGLYQLLIQARQHRGAIDFDTTETCFRLDAEGDVEWLQTVERNAAHRMIEECMIAANVQAAKFLSRHKMPALYRVHPAPPAEKYADLQKFLREFKLRLPPYEDVRPLDFARLLKRVATRPEAPLLRSVLLRSQSLAVYHPENDGHFGLALDAYAHFTSPIRRYPDVLVHRAIRHILNGGKPGEYAYTPADMASLALHCSMRGRIAEEAEREVDERYRCAWLQKHVGEVFAGVVSGVTSFGLFVELLESKISGLVHVSQLPNDYYHFDPLRHLLTGQRRGRNFRLGDPIRVQVLRASMEDRKVDLRLAKET